MSQAAGSLMNDHGLDETSAMSLSHQIRLWSSLIIVAAVIWIVNFEIPESLYAPSYDPTSLNEAQMVLIWMGLAYSLFLYVVLFHRHRPRDESSYFWDVFTLMMTLFLIAIFYRTGILTMF